LFPATVVMPVFTLDTLRDAIGEKQFMHLADLDRDGIVSAAETSRVERAILVGQADIDTRLRNKFGALTDTPPEYAEAVLDCVIYRLYPRGKSPTEDVCKRFEVAIAWAKAVKCDEAQLTGEQPPLRRTSAATKSGPERVFTRDGLKDVM
jgi:phage gp36-like protein